LILILIFAPSLVWLRITSHYCMAAALGGSRKLTTLEESDTKLRQGRRCNYGLKRLKEAWRPRNWQLKGEQEQH
jgi:hypothetical protein